MGVFEFRNWLFLDYDHFSRRFTTIRADDIRELVDRGNAMGRGCRASHPTKSKLRTRRPILYLDEKVERC